jgi:hypothetical protein
MGERIIIGLTLGLGKLASALVQLPSHFERFVFRAPECNEGFGELLVSQVHPVKTKASSEIRCLPQNVSISTRGDAGREEVT